MYHFSYGTKNVTQICSLLWSYFIKQPNGAMWEYMKHSLSIASGLQLFSIKSLISHIPDYYDVDQIKCGKCSTQHGSVLLCCWESYWWQSVAPPQNRRKYLIIQMLKVMVSYPHIGNNKKEKKIEEMKSANSIFYRNWISFCNKDFLYWVAVYKEGVSANKKKNLIDKGCIAKKCKKFFHLL